MLAEKGVGVAGVTRAHNASIRPNIHALGPGSRLSSLASPNASGITGGERSVTLPTAIAPFPLPRYYREELPFLHPSIQTITATSASQGV